MALENQTYRAPSIPKMGKRNFSSPLSRTASVVGGIGAKPRIRASRMSFSGRKKDVDATQQVIVQAPQVQAKNTANVTAALTETNRILVEIQKQLALDFANRIAEKKQNLYATKKNVRKQKLVKKEAFVEKGIDRGKIGALTSRVIAPVKGIFDKILEFLSLVGAGIVINNAWKWLQNPENRKKLSDAFAFLKTYWKELIAIGLAIKLGGAIASLVGFANTLRKIFRRLRDLKGKGKFQKPPKPGSPEFCAGVMNCIKDKVKDVAGMLALALLGTKVFTDGVKNLNKTPAPAPVPVPTGGTPSGQPSGGKSIDELFEEWQKNYKPADAPAPMTFPGTNIPFPTFEDEQRRQEEFLKNTGLPSWSIPLIEGVISAAAMGLGRGRGGFRIPRMQRPVQRPQINLGSSASSPISPQARRTGADFNVTDTRPPGVNLDTGASSPLTRFPRGPEVSTTTPTPKITRSPLETIESGPKRTTTKTTTTSRRPEGVTAEDYKGFSIDISVRAKQLKDNPSIYNVSTGANRMSTKRRLLDIYNGRNPEYQTLTDKASARRILNTDPKNGGFGMNLPEIQPGANPRSLGRQLSEGVTSFTNVPQKRSQGGTIFGQGSQSVDSVPAMLAPGEEVIRASAANLFRPLLKDINDNAGRMWSALSNAIGLQKKNTERQERVSEEFNELTNTFNKHLETLIQEKRTESLKKLEDKMKNGGGGVKRKKPQIHSKPKRTNAGGGFVKTQKRSVPKQIQTYRRGRGGGPGAGTNSSSSEGKITTINMTQPALNMAGQQTPDPPTQSSQSASPSITIRPFDESNEYIMDNYMLYGINT